MNKFIYLLFFIMLAPAVSAATNDVWAQQAYTMFLNMATGYVGRSICIVGGMLGMLWAMGSGKLTMALLGVGGAVFGVFSPTLINALFGAVTI
ncbi:MAG: conjugal transfer protein TraB [Pseudomonadales bacterium]|nr:conjugal transfer protein TraB [Pseudomonadales bacterium]